MVEAMVMSSEQPMATSNGVVSKGSVTDIEYGGMTDGTLEPEVKDEFWEE